MIMNKSFFGPALQARPFRVGTKNKNTRTPFRAFSLLKGGSRVTDISQNMDSYYLGYKRTGALSSKRNPPGRFSSYPGEGDQRRVHSRYHRGSCGPSPLFSTTSTKILSQRG